MEDRYRDCVRMPRFVRHVLLENPPKLITGWGQDSMRLNLLPRVPNMSLCIRSGTSWALLGRTRMSAVPCPDVFTYIDN